MSRNLLHLVSFVLLGGGLGACSASPELPTSATLAPTVQTATAAPAYQLSEKELKMNCKQLTGSIKVRILQMRSGQTDGTLVARTMQSGAVKIWGGPTYGTSPTSEAARDLAQLDAYNQRLAAKKCKTLDLQAELHPDAAAAQTHQVHQATTAHNAQGPGNSSSDRPVSQ